MLLALGGGGSGGATRGLLAAALVLTGAVDAVVLSERQAGVGQHLPAALQPANSVLCFGARRAEAGQCNQHMQTSTHYKTASTWGWLQAMQEGAD